MDAQVNHPKYWMPLVWAGSIVQRARKENRIANDYMMLALIEQIDKFRGMAGGLLNHDWVNIPLVYTQVNIRIFFRAINESNIIPYKSILCVKKLSK